LETSFPKGGEFYGILGVPVEKKEDQGFKIDPRVFGGLKLGFEINFGRRGFYSSPKEFF